MLSTCYCLKDFFRRRSKLPNVRRFLVQLADGHARFQRWSRWFPRFVNVPSIIRFGLVRYANETRASELNLSKQRGKYVRCARVVAAQRSARPVVSRSQFRYAKHVPRAIVGKRGTRQAIVLRSNDTVNYKFSLPACSLRTCDGCHCSPHARTLQNIFAHCSTITCLKVSWRILKIYERGEIAAERFWYVLTAAVSNCSKTYFDLVPSEWNNLLSRRVLGLYLWCCFHLSEVVFSYK